jgi:excisionase family DNA binding protein
MKKKIEDKAILTVPEVAKLFDVHTKTVRRWIQSGKLPAIQPCKWGHYRIRVEDLASFNYEPE